MEMENINVQNSFVAVYQKYMEQDGEKQTTGEYGVGIFKKVDGIGQDIISQSIHPINMTGIGTPKLEGVQLYEDLTGNVVLGELNWENSQPKSYSAIGDSIARFAKEFDGEEKMKVANVVSKINGEYDPAIGMKPLSSITDKESISFEEADELLNSYVEGLGLREEVLASIQSSKKSGRTM